ncbi:MAG: ATPase [Pseudomonadota bacterium]|nr:ATPase [Pseudomonadota bacterium]
MKWMGAAGLAFTSVTAQAEVVSSGPHGFHIRQTIQLVVPQDQVMAAFGEIGSWWDNQHTYSGAASNMSLALSPGGCFCERLPGGGVEHMRVAYVAPRERLVLTGSLGPLLYEATSGVMDVKFERIAGGSRVVMDYKAAGFAAGGADKMAPLVDAVLAEQMRRLRNYARERKSPR